jgi:VWFA-related protein
VNGRRAGWLAVVLVPLALATAGGGEPPVFRAETRSIYVDVSVRRRGAAVRGLAATDFEVRDDGIVQQVELVDAAARPVQALLVFDASSSVRGAKLEALRRAGAAFLDGLRAHDEVALMAFSEEVQLLTAPSTERAAVRAALGRLGSDGATAVFDALYAALTLADPGGRGLVVLFTDGRDNSSILDGRQLAVVAQRSNVLLHVVALKERDLPSPGGVESSQARTLREIAEASGGRLWSAESPDRLRDTFAAIAASMGERYVLRYEPRAARAGWHELRVRVRGVSADVQARRGYWIPASTPRE